MQPILYMQYPLFTVTDIHQMPMRPSLLGYLLVQVAAATSPLANLSNSCSLLSFVSFSFTSTLSFSLLALKSAISRISASSSSVAFSSTAPVRDTNCARISDSWMRRMSTLCAGVEVSGTRVSRGLGMEDSVVVGLDASVEEGFWVVVKIFNVAGPEGLECRDISIGILGFLYFIRGSMSRQNFLYHPSLSSAIALDIFSTANCAVVQCCAMP